MFEFLRQQNYSVYFLQETHLKVESERFIRSCWGYSTWLAGSHTNRNGLALSADLMADTNDERLILVIGPGSGGFSIEILKFVFVDIGQLWVCSINKGFVNAHL